MPIKIKKRCKIIVHCPALVVKTILSTICRCSGIGKLFILYIVFTPKSDESEVTHPKRQRHSAGRLCGGVKIRQEKGPE